jgi:hypothetical protein
MAEQQREAQKTTSKFTTEKKNKRFKSMGSGAAVRKKREK